jgi:hypothetical protein
MATYIATGVVPETGATLTQRITCKGPRLALEIGREWARENALRLYLIEQARTVWVRGRD